MRGLIVLVTLGMLLPIPSTAATDILATAGSPIAHHPSIIIDGDDAFDGPLSGVRSGTGTPADPFIIAHWQIDQEAGVGIRLNGTRAHVIIEDIVTSDVAGRDAYEVECTSLFLYCKEPGAIEILRAQNVTLRRVSVPADSVGLTVMDSGFVVVDGLTVASRTDGSSPRGVVIVDSHDIVIQNSRLDPTVVGIFLMGNARVAIDKSVVTGSSASVELWSGSDTTLSNDTFRGRVDVGPFDPVSRIALVNDTFAEDVSGGNTDVALFCGDRFSNSTFVALWFGAGALRIVGSEFRHDRVAMFASAGGRLEFEHNVVADSTESGAVLFAADMSVHNNTFVRNGWGNQMENADATLNWWGDASGPSRAGPGAGDGLFSVSNVTFDPWLAAPPEGDVDCAKEALPAAPPIIPMVVLTGRTHGGVALRADVRSLANGGVIDISVTTDVNLSATEAAEFVGIAAIDTDRDGMWDFGGTFYGDQEATTLEVAGALPVQRHPIEESEGSLSSGIGCRCTGAFFVMTGGSHGRESTWTITFPQGSDVTVRSADATFVTLADMHEDTARVAASAVATAGASVVVHSTFDAVARTNFTAWSLMWGGLVPNGAFTVTTPSGDVRAAGGTSFQAAAPGMYSYALDHNVEVGAEARVFLIFADI